MSKARGHSLSNASSSLTSATTSTRRRNGPVQSIDTRIASYDRKDPFAAFNTLRKLVETLPTAGHGKNGGIGGVQFKMSNEERRLALGLMSIVEPFIGLAPSRRTLTLLPNEILDAIAGQILSKRDLLSLALSCKRLCDVVVPRHYSYRDVRCRLSSLSVWHHLTVNRALAQNVRRLEILDERASAGRALIPKGIMGSDTDMESSDDERRMNIHGKQEKLFLNALSKMTGLVEFVWSCNHSLVPLVNVWPTLMRFYSLERVEINDNMVFNASHRSAKAISCSEGSSLADTPDVPNLTSVTVRSSKRGLGHCKDPDLAQVTNMLSHCSGLEMLDIHVSSPRNLITKTDDFFTLGRWPALRSLALTKLNCVPNTYPLISSFLFAHTNLEILDLDIGNAATHLTLLDNTLPRIRELRCTKEFARKLMICPTSDGSARPLEVLRGVTLSGKASETPFYEQLRRHKIKRLEASGFTEFEDVKRLVEYIPHVTWLDVGKKLNSATTLAPFMNTTNVVDWANLLTTLPELATFHGVRFFYEAPLSGNGISGESNSSVAASASYRSKIKKNDEVASVLYWKCPKLRRVDCWGNGEDEAGWKRVIILSKDGEKFKWDVKRVKA